MEKVAIWPERPIRRLLVVRLDNLGDIVMLGPAVRVLRRHFPAAQLTALVSKAGSQIAPLLPGIDEVWQHRAVWQDISGAMPLDPARELGFVDELRARQFDAAVIFTSFSQSPYPPAFACYLAGIPIRLGMSKEFGGGILNPWIRSPADDLHQAQRNLYLLKSAGFEFDDEAEERLELAIPAAIQARSDAILRAAGVEPASPFLAIAPGASAKARQYDPAKLGVAARLLYRELRLPMVIIASSREEATVRAFCETAGDAPVVSLFNRTTVPEMCGVIRRAAMLVGMNSGPMHIADAFERPMVILYSGTDYPTQWAPRNSPSLVLRRPTPCSPCYLFECPYQMQCLDVPPKEVADQTVSFFHQIAAARCGN